MTLTLVMPYLFTLSTMISIFYICVFVWGLWFIFKWAKEQRQ